jgi:hypothetical protein
LEWIPRKHPLVVTREPPLLPRKRATACTSQYKLNGISNSYRLQEILSK